MSPRISKIVHNCESCPNYQYFSGGAYHCGLLDERILDAKKVSEFCPLPNYPSRQISHLQHTLVLHDTEEAKINLSSVILRHLSAVFKTPVSNYGNLILTIKKRGDETREVVISRDFISGIDLSREEILFTYKNQKYKAFGTHEGWKLSEAVQVAEVECWRGLAVV